MSYRALVVKIYLLLRPTSRNRQAAQQPKLDAAAGRSFKGSAALGLALLLGACGQSSTPAVSPALAPFTGQTLNWQSCDPTLLSSNFPSTVISALGDRIECADIQVPLDWNAPGRGNLEFSLLRVKAGNTAQRKGSFFFNPGGPGADGLLTGVIFGYLWSQADLSTRSGAALKQLSDEYDLIGFSPRGTGQSSQLTCASSDLYSPEHYQTDDRSQTNIDAMLRNAELVARACLKSPIMPYINTDQTARDLNLARQLLGDTTFNYVGYSYGTWLGSWYAKLFPAQTGRVLLDGNLNTATTFESAFGLQPMGFQRAFEESVLAYAARHPVFELGNTETAVYDVYTNLPSDIKLTLQQYPNSIITDMYTDSDIPNVAVAIVAARGLSAVVQAHPSLNSSSALTSLLSSYTYAADFNTNSAAKSEALAMLDTYLGIVNNATGPVQLDAAEAVFYAVISNDSAWNKDPDYWINLGNQQALSYPLLGGSATEQPGSYWTAPTTSKPATPTTMPPILMLQNELDPATPREGAFAALSSLPSAKMIFIDNEAQHTAFPYDTDCVDAQVAEYLLNGTLPDSTFTVCPAKPLPGETQVYAVDNVYTTGNTLPSPSLANQALEDQPMGAQPTLAPTAQVHSALSSTPDTQNVLKLLKDIIRRNAIRPPGQR